jgi:hypothetical protein
MPGTPLPGRFRPGEAAVLLPALAGDVAVQQFARPLSSPAVADLDDLRICAGSVRELDHAENPVGEHDY